jgi:hypothetical protein
MKEIINVIDDKTVESSQGWRVDISSIDSFQYQEQGKTISFEIEDCPDELGEISWIIYLPANWIWKSMSNNEPVAGEKIPEILNRVSLAFWKIDMKIKEMV